MQSFPFPSLPWHQLGPRKSSQEVAGASHPKHPPGPLHPQAAPEMQKPLEQEQRGALASGVFSSGSFFLLLEALTKISGEIRQQFGVPFPGWARWGIRGHCCSFPRDETGQKQPQTSTASDRDLNNSSPTNPPELVNTASSYLEILRYPGVSNKLIERKSPSSSASK